MKKRKIASAIGYKNCDLAKTLNTPVLLASGRDREAEQIIAIAHEAGIEVMEDAALAALLDTSVTVGDFIPPELWEAVAKVLAFVSRTKV